MPTATGDRSERRRAEERVRDSDERFHSLIDAVIDYAIFMLDADGHVASWNSGARRLKGYAPEEIIGKHFSVFYTPEDRERQRPSQILETVRRQGRFEDEGWRVRKDGSRFWANIVITPLHDPGGTLVGFAKITRDLSARRNAEEQLRRSEERFRLLVENIGDYAIYMLDQEGRVASWNLGAERLKGYRAEEIIGQHFSLLFPPEDAANGRPQRELEQARTSGRFEDEGFRIRKDGTRFWAHAILTAVHDAHGTLVGFAKITRDLSARREAEENERRLIQERTARAVAEEAERKLRESEERYRALSIRLEEASRAKDEFLATVSHELRTPLSSILGWSTILKDRMTDPGLLKPIRSIHRNAQAQARIIEDILDVSRVITGKFHIDPRPVDLVEVARQAADVVRPSAMAKSVSLTLDLERPSCLLVADPERLQQVIWNLLSNAVKFTPSGGAVALSIEQVDAHVVLRVSDTGIGVDSAFLPYVFDRFRQADPSSTRQCGGLGLGLALVRHIVELHGGTVEATSAGRGTGATFSIRLPIRAVAAPPSDRPTPTGATKSKPLHATLSGVRVLVVDDDLDAREVISTLLEDAGAVVLAASSAGEGLATIERFVPQVIVSDVAMPGEDGFAFIEKLRKLPSGKDIPALALTAFARVEDHQRALEAGFNGHLGKPVEPDLLSSVVASLAKHGSLRTPLR